MFKKLFKNEDGVTAVEYGLIAALIAAAVIVTAGPLGTKVAGEFSKITAALP